MVNEFNFCNFLRDNLNMHSTYNDLMFQYERLLVLDYLKLYDIEVEKDTKVRIRKTTFDGIEVYFVSGIKMLSEKEFLDYIFQNGNDGIIKDTIIKFCLTVPMNGGNELPSVIILEDMFNLFFESFDSVDFSDIINLTSTPTENNVYKYKYEEKNEGKILLASLANFLFAQLDIVQDLMYHSTWFYSHIDLPSFNDSFYYKKIHNKVYEYQDIIKLGAIYNLFDEMNRDENITTFMKLLNIGCNEKVDDSIMLVNFLGINDKLIDKLVVLVETYSNKNIIGNNFFECLVNLNLALKRIYESEIDKNKLMYSRFKDVKLNLDDIKEEDVEDLIKGM